MLDADRIADRRRLKRSLTFWRLAAIVALVVLAVSAVLPFAGGTSGEYVARLHVTDIIYSETWRDRALRDAIDDPACKALLVRIDSPGGTFVGGESLMRGLRRVSETKPVIAVMGEMATSGGYMTALGADHIIANPGTITGSIGVIMQTADVTELLDMLGIRPEVLKSGPFKAQPNPMERFTDEAREAVQALIMDSFQQFVGMVAERRGRDREEILALADGRIFTGRQALENGLIDALGDEDSARAWLERERGVDGDLPIRDIEPPAKALWLQDLVGGTLGKVLFSERVRLDGLLALWQPGLR